MSIHLQYDVSVVFATQGAAADAWESVLKSPENERRLWFEGILVVWHLHLQSMESSELDFRLCANAPTTAWISATADLTALFGTSVRRWDGGCMDQIREVVVALLDAGGEAVVLHKAAGVIKSGEQFRDELTRDPDGIRAWLDLLLTQDNETRCRIYGMPHYLGLPNIHVHSAHVDSFAAERCLRAATAALVRSSVSDQLDAPMWFDESPAISWDATHDVVGLAVHLRSEMVETQNPSWTWPQTDFEMYALMISDLVLREFWQSQFRLFDSVLIGREIPRRILCLECAGVCLYVTAGFGRFPTQNGNLENATLFAEFAAFGPATMAMINHLSILAEVAFESSVPGGVKDYDILAEAPNKDGYIAMPLHDLKFGPQPIALRVLCPFFAFERPEMAIDPRAWCERNLGSFTAIYDRWAQKTAED